MICSNIHLTTFYFQYDHLYFPKAENGRASVILSENDVVFCQFELHNNVWKQRCKLQPDSSFRGLFCNHYP